MTNTTDSWTHDNLVERLLEHSIKFEEACNERCLEVMSKREIDSSDVQVFEIGLDVKINVTYTSTFNKYCYCVYSSYTVFYNSYHPLDKVTKKLYKIRYFFDMQSAILYAKHLQGHEMSWSISKNPLKRFMYKFKRSLNRIKIL